MEKPNVTCVIGIDPGKSGAIAAIYHDCPNMPRVIDMPTYEIRDGKSKKRHLDRKRIIQVIRDLAAMDNTIVILEKQQAYPNQGAVSNYSTGFGYAVILTALDSLALPYEEVHPKTWQKHFSIREKTKGQSCEKAANLFPKAELRGPKGAALDGRSDALLMAEYMRRKIGW
jgi:hypothetical protein